MKKPRLYCAKCRAVHDDVCPKKPKHGWHRHVKSKPGRGKGWSKRRKVVFEKNNYLCQICLIQGKITPVDLHGPNHGVCDHIIALTLGGLDEDSNLQTICQTCNKIKIRQDQMVLAKNGKINDV